MKINIVGAGPAGLYFGILWKHKHPESEVTIFERNAPDATFGWGVVFSDKTLSYLRDADPYTYVAIIANFATWDNVDVVHRDASISIHGNKFSGIARIKLLRILQHRCRELGVRLYFESPIVDIDSLRDCDLLIGADGVSSTVRGRYADHFSPEVSAQSNKYIWFGTRRLFHGLTLTFRENDDGVFAAHSYKYDKRTSTFIVECDSQTWSNAAFDSMSEDAVREYLEGVFAIDLRGEALLSNNSRWINFLDVKNQNWRFENVVLLGDALHTAHFSIGSGTKLALEDSIALNGCLSETISVPKGLEKFQAIRKPVIAEYQAAASESLRWFENCRTHIALEPMELAFSLMTRSKRIDSENLRRRDPQFVADYESWRLAHR